MTLTDTILANPLAVSLLGTLLLAAVAHLRSVGPREALAYDRVRRLAWRALDPVARRHGRPLLRDKTGRDDEHIATVDCGLLALLRALWTAGFRWNPLSTVKHRTIDGRRQVALSVVWRDGVDADVQQDVHIFRSPGGGWDLLGHLEPSVTDPDGHVGGAEQVPGDPEGVVRDALPQIVEVRSK